MSGSVQSAAERCRELRAAEYDSYYHTVLLSVGLMDAFGGDGPCIFKVSEPTYSQYPRSPTRGAGGSASKKEGNWRARARCTFTRDARSPRGITLK